MTLQELLDDLNGRISSAKVEEFWTQDQKIRYINQAGQMVCDYRPWEFLKRAVSTTTRNEKEYYDYPEAAPQIDGDSYIFNNIYNIVIEDEEYPDGSGRTRVPWDIFQKHKNTDSGKQIFTNHNKYYFLYPIPDDGKEMNIYGLIKWRELSEMTDEAVVPKEFQNAVVTLAYAKALKKAKRYDEAQVEMQEIISPEGGMLAIKWQQYEQEAPKGYIGRHKHSRE